jgi:hypothetical protein
VGAAAERFCLDRVARAQTEDCPAPLCGPVGSFAGSAPEPGLLPAEAPEDPRGLPLAEAGGVVADVDPTLPPQVGSGP